MSGMWHQTMVYLGLKEESDETYEQPRRDAASVSDEPERQAPGNDRGEGNIRPLRAAPATDRAPAPQGARAAIVEIAAFEDAEAVGARFRTGQPVVFDASTTDADVGRRVLDFVSGMTYALHGRLVKVGGRAFLVVPEGVRLHEDEVDRLSGLGYRLPTGSGA